MMMSILLMIIYPNFHQEGTGQSSTGLPGAKTAFYAPWFYSSITFFKTYPHWDVSFSKHIFIILCFKLYVNSSFLDNEFRNILVCEWQINQSINQSINIYFVSDVPHLFKTTRNNYQNPGANLNTRSLIVKWNRQS